MPLDDDLEITRTIGLLFLRHPELVDRVSYDELRRMAAERKASRRDPVPTPFLVAFAERER